MLPPLAEPVTIKGVFSVQNGLCRIILLNMFLLDQLAEAEIRRAIEQGQLDDLPGSGRPLQFDDDSLIPEELRAAYRLMKNAGFVPPEVGLRREIRHVEQLLARVETRAERSAAARRLNVLLARLGAARGDRADLRITDHYYEKIHARLGRGDAGGD